MERKKKTQMKLILAYLLMYNESSFLFINTLRELGEVIGLSLTGAILK